MTTKELKQITQFFAKEVVGLEYPYSVDWSNLSEQETSVTYYSDAIFVPGALYDNDDTIGNENTTAIYIHSRLKNKPMYMLIDTLIHELIHYKLWFLGYDHEDDSKDFIDECHRLGICSNYDMTFNNKTKRYTFNYNHEILSKYENMYNEYKASLV